MTRQIRTHLLVWTFLCLAMLGFGTADLAAAEAPGKVDSVTITVTGQLFAKLQWTQAGGVVSGYTIIRDDKAIARVSGRDVLAYVDETIDPGKSYTYTVRAHYKDDQGKYTYGKAASVCRIADGYVYEKTAGGDVILTGYTGKEEKVRIPEAIEGGKVRVIGDSCFRGNVWIKALRVPEGVTEIQNYGFEACSRMTKVSLPDSLKTIGDAAFNGCASLKYLEIPDGVTSIGKGAFLYCCRLPYVDIPENVTWMGDFAFAGCERLNEAGINSRLLEIIPDRAFCNCSRLEEVTISSGVKQIGKRAFSGCISLKKILFQGNDLTIGDYAFERCANLQLDTNSFLQEKQGGKTRLSLGFGVFSMIENGIIGDRLEMTFLFPDDTVFAEGCFYGSTVSGIANLGSLNDKEKGFDHYILDDGVLYSSDKKTLVHCFATTIIAGEWGIYFENTDAAMDQRLTVPEGVSEIGPYAFCGYAFCGKDLQEITLSSTMAVIKDNAFTLSTFGKDRIILKKADGSILKAGDSIYNEKAFDNYQIDPEYYTEPEEPESQDDPIPELEDVNPEPEDGSPEPEDGGPEPEDGSPEPEEENIVTSFDFSTDAEGGIFHADQFKGYLDIHEGFKAWCESYAEYNKDYMPVTKEAMPYITMYSGEDYYRQMTSALNGDAFKTSQSIVRSGDDYREMFLMIDHGLFAELSRGKMPGNLVLYSGITSERVAALADPGKSPVGASGPVTEEQKQKIIARIGKNYEDNAIMSTTADPYVAFAFSSGSEFSSQTIVVIYASKEAMELLGSVCISSVSRFPGEEEILFNKDARYRIMDVGTVRAIDTAYDSVSGNIIRQEETDQRTYVRIELLGGVEGDPEKIDEPAPADPSDNTPEEKESEGQKTDPKEETKILAAPKISRTQAQAYSKKTKKMKISWSQVKDAAGYRLSYKKTGSASWKTVSTKNTSEVIKGMKTGGCYQIRVAAMDGAGRAGSWSKISYVLYKKMDKPKLTAQKKAILVKWNKAGSVSGYQILIARNKALEGAGTIKVKGKNKTSYMVKKLKSGSLRYVAVCPYLNKGGKMYAGFNSGVSKKRVK